MTKFHKDEQNIVTKNESLSDEKSSCRARVTGGRAESDIAETQMLEIVKMLKEILITFRQVFHQWKILDDSLNPLLP